jgi:hypothetical protein
MVATFAAAGIARVTLSSVTGFASEIVGATTSVVLGHRYWRGNTLEGGLGDRLAGGARLSGARRLGRFVTLAGRGALIGWGAGELAENFMGGSDTHSTVHAGEAPVDTPPIDQGIDNPPQPPVEHGQGEQPSFSLMTDEIGKWDGKFDADTNYYNGTGYNAIAHSLMDAYQDTTGSALNWQDLRYDTPGFEQAYHNFVGDVLENNDLTWEDARSLPSDTVLEIPPEALTDFAGELNEVTDGKFFTSADFGLTGENVAVPQALEAQVSTFDNYLESHRPEANVNPDQYANQYMTWLQANDQQSYAAFQAMSEAQQAQFTDLIKDLVEQQNEERALDRGAR